MAVHLIWFRNDLRIQDNLALYHACKDDSAQVIAIYIATPKQWRQHNMSPRQCHFIYQHLQQLHISLNKLNISLIYQEVEYFKDAISTIELYCQKYQVTDIFFNQQYEWNEQQRDHKVIQLLQRKNIQCHFFDDAVLISPNHIVTANGSMYRVFTPFQRRYHQYFLQNALKIVDQPNLRHQQQLPLQQSELIRPFNYPLEANHFFPVGETQALQLLDKFCREDVEDYLNLRDLPAINGTSQLSAYLTIGILSPRQCLAKLQSEHPRFLDFSRSGAYGWFCQLVWREFYYHLLACYPKLSKNLPFIDWTKYIVWRNNQSDFIAWQNGLTGYPIVDAAMRQLKQTGWMHNRLRLITASFLVKDLLIDWRWGETYFMSQLIDGNLAANNGGWQWSASTGTDAAPYFRIFNPTTQGQRFDPKGKFIRQYLPELAQVPDKYIHQPHVWAKQQQIKLDYPTPIITHSQARLNTLNAYNDAKSS